MELALTNWTDQTPDALDTALSAERPRLLRIARTILRDRDEAEDVVQHTLLAVWRRAQDRPIANLAGYLGRAVYWNALKRRARRRADLPLEALGDPATGPSHDELDPFDLERAIAELPASQQTAIRLRFYLGLSFREIGSNLAISTNTAASRVRYALATLRRRLGVAQRRPERHRQGGA